ncbi:MAG: D-tyrosyl-tRNA(Tyr) deacylase [Oscillospiraceae bacterium]|nr:D-tyrosyl-tRNA(Tyr) deacylase [Oscillospiraceae bacterium]
MKALVQRVRYARVTINGEEIRETGPGLLVLFGCAEGDDIKDCRKLAEKTANLRIFTDSQDKMNLSALELGLSAMVVSQFTLLADTKKGNRPSFIAAAKPPLAVDAYEEYVRILSSLGLKEVKTGEFGADMQVEICNDGPVTVMLDTEEWKR